MNIMTKRGNLDNIVTYEHICDSDLDLPNIPQEQATLGSTAITLHNTSGGFAVYMVDSSGNWVPLLTNGGSGGSFSFSDALHVCTSGEYDDQTGLPTVSPASSDFVYLVPTGTGTNDLYDAWIYINDAWEKFGSSSAGGGSTEQSDWEETSGADPAFILNKPAIWRSHSTNAPATAVVINGSDNTASAAGATAIGSGTNATGENSFAEGTMTTASSYNAHAEGWLTTASEYASHSEGYGTTAEGIYTHAEGYQTIAKSDSAHAEGRGGHYNGANNNTITPGAAGTGSHVEGYQSRTVSSNSVGYISKGLHAEGYQTTAGNATVEATGAHAEGNGSTASASASHAEGVETTASAQGAHSEGMSTQATGLASHAEGAATIAAGTYSHAGGLATSASTNATTVFGINNSQAIENNQLINGWANPYLYQDIIIDKYAHPIFIVGNGVEETTGWIDYSGNSNAMTLFLNGDVCFDGLVYVGRGEQRYNPLNAFYEDGSDGLKYYYTEEPEYPSTTPTIASAYVPYIVYYDDTLGLYYYDDNGYRTPVNI